MNSNLRLLIITIFIAVFSNCSEHKPQKQKVTAQKQEKRSNLEQRIKIKWLAHWYGLGKKEQLIREIARDFSFLNQNIEIELEFPHEMLGLRAEESTYLGVIDSITGMIKANEWPYDIMLCDVYRYNGVAEKIEDKKWGQEYLVDFRNKKWFNASHKDEILKNKVYSSDFGDIAPGAFIEGVWNMLYISSDVEKRLGIEVKEYDMNWDDFLNYAQIVDSFNKTHQDSITLITFPRTDTNPFFAQIVLSALQNSDGVKESAISALYDTFIEIQKLAPFKPLSPYLAYNNDKVLHSDKALFTFYPSWINLYWQKLYPEKSKVMRPCEIPTLKASPITYSGKYSSIFVVPKNAKNRVVAESLMKFISSDETARKWTKYSKCPTGLKERIEYSDFATDSYTKFSNHISSKYNDKLDEINLSYYLFNTNKPINFYFNDVITGNLKATEAIELVKKQLNSI